MDSIVIGAGMVGVSTALALQQRGHDVLLIDRAEPGSETSYGNAGIIQTEAVQPYAIPLSLPRLARIALGNAHDVAWKPSTAQHWFFPLARYFWNSLPANYAKIIPEYAKLILRASDDHAPFIAASDANELIHKNGFIQAYRGAAGFDAALADAQKTLADYGVPFAALDSVELAAMEPNLRVKMHGAIHYKAVWTCTSPGELVKRYTALFIARGGRFERGSVRTILPGGSGWRAHCDTGSHTSENLVVALGPWAPHLLRPLGYNIGMIYKRGYHQHFETSAPPIRPIMDVEHSTVFSPMKTGLRVLTGAELNSVNGASNHRQIQHSAEIARELFAIGAAVETTPWRGARPCMPDMLPVVGKASDHKGLWFNFGHGHQGFTLGPTTGHILAAAMSGDADPNQMRRLQRY